MNTKEVHKIVIVGGGTAGWMTAAMLSKHFRKTAISITLIESSAIGTVGVGEATIPTLRRFYAELGLDDMDVMRRTQATCKLGIKFKDWYQPGSDFIHPFGLYGQKANGIDFIHYWMKLRSTGDTSKLADYSLGVNLAQQSKFIEPSPRPPSELSVFDWALHFDASQFALLMREYAEANGVRRVDAKIERIQANADVGVESLFLDNGEVVSADLYIDCSGFRGLLIQEALETGYEDWSEWLMCDRAVAVQSTREGPAPSYTVSQAHKAGWQWKIPLQHRQGNGHVYCSRYVSEDEAITTLREHTSGEWLHEPRKFGFTAGRRKKAWNKNVIAVGLSSGFLEPLESTSIALIETAIEKIRRAFRGPFFTKQHVDEFNDLTAQEYERVRDFIILHYKLNQRDDSAFWRECRDMVLPDKLAEKVAAFRERGELIRYPIEIFGPPSWIAIYDGFNYLPEKYDQRIDRMSPEYLQKALEDMRNAVASAVNSAPSHEEFIRQHCAAPAPK
ncbi:tryptophan 7-halogenase [Gilvimarinus sp. SDUM040013]|uniref:Tryptophan halogenase family protein n=1 Tax=Gilvimarinus gilvus TaxID=3058038 RepID=A0ABU4RYG2_9GAMM|nr:tryptophan halogenase family protein [Gilvimarinus sp. SDUM040013]MDO3385223.1 tryptophan 7-halogenase [Gilvimarinus sp. SDUM040013]MDX6849206.1 tryptophan halogenase family protein [Gilvimarinus sp. SDUM040013]